MAKYRKKPVIVDATEWNGLGDHKDVWPSTYFVKRSQENQICNYCQCKFYKHGWISTLEGGHIVCPGDFIITGVHGEHYPCKPDIFAETYELVEED